MKKQLASSTLAVALASLTGCAAFAPLDDAERARIRIVAPAAARFPPKIDFRMPPGKAEGAASTGALMAIFGSTQICAWFIYTGPGFLACLAAHGGVGAAIGAVVTPSNEGFEIMTARARRDLGAPDVQQLLTQRLSERITRLTSLTIDPSAMKHGPQSRDATPSYAGLAAGEGTLVAEIAVESLGAALDPTRLLQIELTARMRLVRLSDGVTLMIRNYSVARYGRFLQEYDDDGTRLLLLIAGTVEEIATLMVDDAFLLRSDTTGSGAPAVTALEPLLPGRLCLVLGYDCWAFKRVPTLDTVSPRFRWKPFPEPDHLQAAPWLRAARNIVYDLWIFGGEDDRLAEGLVSTEHTLEQPLTPCTRYSWAVRARYDTDAGPRAVEWSTASGYSRTELQPGKVRPTFGAPFITACPAQAGAPQAR